MNAAEEIAVNKLITATTVGMRREALTALCGRGVRLTEATRATVRAALSSEREDAGGFFQLAHHPLDSKARRLEHGPRPILEDDTEIVEWVTWWKNVGAIRHAGAPLPGGLLLHGPPGTGKTTTAAWIAGELSETNPAFVLDAHDWVSSHLGESGSKLKAIFEGMARASSLLVLEEIDTVGMNRDLGDGAAGAERNNISVALMRLIEDCQMPVIATTNRVDVLDPALLRRFDVIVELPEPTMEDKREIVARHLGGARIDLDLTQPIVELVREAKKARRRAAIPKHRKDTDHA